MRPWNREHLTVMILLTSYRNMYVLSLLEFVLTHVRSVIIPIVNVNSTTIMDFNIV